MPGLEVVGTVRSAPEGSGLSVGERVCATTTFGGWAEVALAPTFLTHPLPGAVSFPVAAGMLINYQTAYLGLARRGRLAAGESVLVHGAAGGVGAASIQVAKALGAGTVIAVASTEEKRRSALAAGADHALDGLLVIGFASGRIPQLPVNKILLRHLDVLGVNYGGMLPFEQGFAARAAEQLPAWIVDGTLAPQIAEPLPLAQGARALEALAERRAVGKPVLLVR